MRISKIMVALLVSVVALTAMTGVVVGLFGGAIEATDSSGNTNLMFKAGDKVYATGVVISDYDGSGVDVYVTDDVAWTDGDTIATSSTVIIHLTGVTPAQIASTVYLGDVSNGGGASDIPYPASGTYAYDILVDIDRDGVYETTGVAYEDFVNDVNFGCKAFETEVPEFATIAIPAIAVLGLFLFFNKRKHKKD